jgi:hypothetical protein
MEDVKFAEIKPSITREPKIVETSGARIVELAVPEKKSKET